MRGASRGLELNKYVAAHGKVHLEFEPGNCRPSVDKHSSWLSAECGSIARRFAPQRLPSWSHISNADFISLFDRLKVTFFFLAHVNDGCAS